MGEKVLNLRERALQALVKNDLDLAISRSRIMESRAQDMLHEFASCFGDKPDNWDEAFLPELFRSGNTFAFKIQTGDLTIWWGIPMKDSYTRTPTFFLMHICPDCLQQIPGEDIRSLEELGRQIRPGVMMPIRRHTCSARKLGLNPDEDLLDALGEWINLRISDK